MTRLAAFLAGAFLATFLAAFFAGATSCLGCSTSGTADTGTLFFADGTTGTETYRGSVGYAHSDDALLFGTAATERMRIDTSGSLLVGTTSFTAGGKGFVVRNDNAGGTYTQIGATSTSAWDVAYFYNPNGLVGSITVSGSATAYNTSSDQRLKTNIVNAPSGNIDDIKVRSFDWIADGSHQEYGMVAQELLEVAPYAVNKPENPNEMMGVDYSKLVPMMVKEIQDLKAEVNQLKAKIGV